MLESENPMSNKNNYPKIFPALSPSPSLPLSLLARLLAGAQHLLLPPLPPAGAVRSLPPAGAVRSLPPAGAVRSLPTGDIQTALQRAAESRARGPSRMEATSQAPATHSPSAANARTHDTRLAAALGSAYGQYMHLLALPEIANETVKYEGRKLREQARAKQEREAQEERSYAEFMGVSK